MSLCYGVNIHCLSLRGVREFVWDKNNKNYFLTSLDIDKVIEWSQLLKNQTTLLKKRSAKCDNWTPIWLKLSPIVQSEAWEITGPWP